MCILISFQGDSSQADLGTPFLSWLWGVSYNHPSQPAQPQVTQEARNDSQLQEVNSKSHLPIIPLTIKQNQKKNVGWVQG